MSTTIVQHQVADGVFAFTGTDVNWVVIRDGTELTLVDAGWHGDVQEVERSIRSLGRRPQDLRAVLLTHAHADHIGALNHLHDNYGVPVYCAAAEVPNAPGEITESAVRWTWPSSSTGRRWRAGRCRSRGRALSGTSPFPGWHRSRTA